MAISLRESIEVGFADIWTRKIRSIVTVVGIILGVMSIMVVLAIVSGMNASTMQWMNERGGLTKIEVHRDWGLDRKQWSQAVFSMNELRFIRSLIPEAKAFNPTIRMFRTPLTKGDINYDTDLMGVMPDMVIVDEWGVQSGRFINEYDVNNHLSVIVLGSKVKDELFGNRNPIGEYVVVRGQALQVVGVMTKKVWNKPGGGFDEANFLDYMNKRSFISLTTMLHVIAPNQTIDQFEVKTHSAEEAVKLRVKLNNIILNLKQGNHWFEVTSAQEMMAEMKKNSLMFTVIFVLIAVISLLVGGIVIMNIMLASIQERTREIGVRLAIGARRKDIFIQFLVQTILITSIGGVIGILVGYSILGMVGKYLQVEVIATVQMIWTALAVSVGVGLVFGITPAIKASNLDPVTALRNE
jgi:ABC-type antimicrobial peptide transport system permease subunit